MLVRNINTIVMGVLREEEKEIPLTPSMKGIVRKYANDGGGIYRMNTRGASYYSFTPFKDRKGNRDFCGGWDWLSTAKETYFSYIYDITKDEFYSKREFELKFI